MLRAKLRMLLGDRWDATPSPHHGRAVGDVQLAEDVRDVIAHRLQAQHQPRRDSAFVAPCAIVES